MSEAGEPAVVRRRAGRGDRISGRRLAVALVVAAALTACASSKATPKTSVTTTPGQETSLFSTSELNQPETAGKPVVGGSATFGLESTVATLVPGQMQQPADLTVGLAFYDPIVGFDSRGRMAPTGLASGWTNSPDLKTWTFTLRPGIRFSDGSPADAAAVVTQVNAQKHLPDCTCSADVAHIVGVAALDARTVRFTLDQANVAFDSLLAGGTGFLASPGSWASGPAQMTRRPIGTGPFKAQIAGELDLSRNPYYWRRSSTGQRLPYLDHITFVPLPDSRSRLPALRNGTVDIAQTADTSNLVQAKRDPNLIVQPASGTSSTILVLNSTRPPFNDLRMRQALNDAIDRDALNNQYYGGTRIPAYGPLPQSNPFYDPRGQLPRHDAAKAAALVAQLRADGKPVSYTSLCINTPEAAGVYAILNAQGQKVGLRAREQSVDQATLVTKLLSRSGDFQLACFRNAQISDPDGLYTSYYRTAGNNISLYSNYTVDEALRAGRKTTDVAARRLAYDIVQENLARDIVVVPLLFDLYGNIHTTSISGLSRPLPNALGLIDPGDLYRVQG